MIRYSTSHFPATPLDGELLYDGTDTSATHDTTLENNLYYTDFCYDAFGNYSSGTTLSVAGPTGGENAANTTQPDRFELFQNYPNPFNASTTIKYRLGVGGRVNLSIVDLLGRIVRHLVQKKESVGEHSIIWDGRDDSGNGVGSGVYFCQLKTANGYSRTRKLLLLK